MDGYAKYLARTGVLRNKECEAELVTTLHLADGTTQEITHTRRVVCKKAVKKKNVTVLTFADVDRDALQRVFPFETFTVSDFPEIFVDHVGRRIQQGVGDARKVPMTWITKTGGTWKYAGPKVIGTPGTVLAVYRGTQPGQGSVVNATEYTTGTATGNATGVKVLTVNFAREQIDFQGRPYVIEIDVSLPGDPRASVETSRILTAFGITPDAASFAAAAIADTAAGSNVDTLYGGNGRTGNAIIEDLLRVARGWLSQTATGAWAIVQDIAKVATKQFDTSTDLIEIDEYGDGDIVKTVTLDYRPRASDGEDFTGHLSRSTSGVTGEMQLKNPYIRDHVVADKHICYWQKRLTTLKVARGTLHAAQLANGEVINVTDNVSWRGAKDLIATGITRPADSNRLTLREYDANVYVYTSDPLPNDATNVYSPDYAFTDPLAPTGLTLVSQGTSSDTDGKTTAFALVRAVPPALNWSELWVQLTDTTTTEQYTQQLFLTAGNYDAVFSGLRPNRLHSIKVWAKNSNGRAGATATISNFTTANYTTTPSAPGGVTLTQILSKEVRASWPKVADVAGTPAIRRYIVFIDAGGAGYAEVARTPDLQHIFTVSTGSFYQVKVRAEDINQNESADSTSASITAAKVLDDSYLISQGVTGVSIGNGSINQGRSYTGTGSATSAIAASGTATIGMDVYTFFPGLDKGSGAANPVRLTVPGSKGGSPDAGWFRVDNDDATTGVTVHVDWRKFNA